MSSVNVYTKQLCLDGKPPEAQNGSTLPKMNQQRQQQEHKITSPTTGQTRQHTTEYAQTKEKMGSGVSSSDNCRSSSAVPMMDLYSLGGFLNALLSQERILWDRNELLTKSFKRVGTSAADSLSDKASTTSMTGSSASNTSTSATNSTNAELSTEGLYFIRYGQLTNTIHKYFRRLEKSHACLHLTARRAKHDTFRRVGRTDVEDLSEDQSTVSCDTTPPRITSRDNSVVVLRDEELLVYRCALMCAQFPMLSAPCPPDGRSPTPSPPILPSAFTTTTLAEEDLFQESDPALSLFASDTSNKTSKECPVTLSDADSKTASQSSRPLFHIDSNGSLEQSPASASSMSSPSVHSVDGGQKPSNPHRKKLPANGVCSNSQPPENEPVAVKGSRPKVRSKSIRRHSGLVGMSDATYLAKLPPVDSDEEMELVKLEPHGIPASGGEATPTGREHPFSPMVNREMLLNLVRDAFQQTDEQQINFEATLKQEYSRRSKGEILAKELVSQLQVLDNNAHPFYKPRLFVTRNGYDLWLQGEKERVRKLIEKFWHCSLPRPQLWRSFNPIDYHRAYVILLQKVINVESRTDRKEPVHAGKTPSSPLSPTAKRLLREFGLRYGVGVLYQQIVYLEYLAKHFDYEIWYIKHCTEALRSIRSSLPRIRNQVTAVRREMDILRSTIQLLHGQTDNSLTRIHRLFTESDPRKGVASLIELLAEVLDVEQNLFGKKVRPVKDWLIRYLKSGFVLRYERRKQIASAETVDTKTVQPFTLSPTLVNSLLLDTRDEVIGFRDKFQSVFRPYFDIVPFSMVEFYRLLCNDACCLCSAMINKAETRNTIPLEMLGLVYRLNERDIDWQNVIDPELQKWRQRFQTLACTWMDMLSNQIQKWTLDAVEKDQWTLLVFDMYPQCRPPSSTSFSPFNSVQASWNHATTTNAQIVSSIRISPFPSPPVSETGQPTSSSKVRIGEGSGAFTPYSMLKRHFKTSPAISESSGGVTTTDGSLSVRDTCSSACFSITSDVPYHLKHQGKQRGGTPGSIVTFAQKKTSSGAGKGMRRSGANGDHVTVDPSNQIEVSVSVYSGSDEDCFSPISSLHLPSLDGDNKNNNTSFNFDQIFGTDQAHLAKADLFTNTNDLTRTTSTGTLTTTELAQSLTSTDEVQVVFVESSSTGLATSNAHSVDGAEVDGGMVNGVGSAPSVRRGAARLSLSVSSADQPNSSFKVSSPLDKCNADDSETILFKPPGFHPSLPTSSSGSTDGTNVTATIPATTTATNGECPTTSHNGKSQPMNVSWLGRDGTASPILAAAQGTSACRGSDDTIKNQSMSNAVPSGVDENTSMPRMTPPSPPQEEVEEGESFAVQSFLFPVSNSPLDLVTMLMRMAHFTGELLSNLTPKVSKTEHLYTEKLGQVTEYAPEVIKARHKAYERQRCAQQLKTTFLKKLNKAMINSLMLYADNLLCMDLCCWSVHDAIKLIGLQHLNHLSRRRDCDEIWGCRHMVEANHGLHPSGIPCHKKSVEKFESVTRDMCIRINNIHVLVTIFHSLERRICNMVKTDSKRPVSAFSYISSDHSEVITNMKLLCSKTAKPAPCRTRYKTDTSLFPGSTAESNKGSSSWPSSVSNGLGPMEPDAERKLNAQPTLETEQKAKESDDALSKQSLDCLRYLKNVQQNQVKMIAIRMNKFCKRALSELLGLKLGPCPIEKRLKPVVDYLDRHRVALRKYVYPECYSQIVENLWDCLLQDLEEEATKLRSNKRPITDRAQMLLRSLTHLIQFMHNRQEGLDIDILNSTSEYLQGLLDIMTRSTDQLIRIFNRLNTFTTLEQNHVSALVDSNLLQRLRSHLRYNRKCFSGAEFVSKVIEIGQGTLAGTMDSLDEERQQHASHMFYPVDQTGNLVNYNEDYANTMACYLLEEGILIPVTRATTLSDRSGSSMSLVTPNCVSDEEETASVLDSLLVRGTEAGENGNMEDLVLQVSEALSQGAGLSNQEVPSLQEIYPATDTSGSRQTSGRGESQQHHSYHGEARMNGNGSQYSDKLHFSATNDAYYKFAASEDAEYISLLQSEVLVASSAYSGDSHRLPCSTSTPQPLRDGAPTENQDFLAAKRGTLYLVLDLLMQRARKERVAKQFLTSPRTKIVQEQRKLEDSNCDLIFKMS